MRERRRLGGVARVEANVPPLHALEDVAEALGVHGLGEAVAHRLPHDGVLGDLDGAARRVVLAGDLRGEDGREQIVGPHALEKGRHLLASLVPQHCQGARRVPAPACAEHRGLEDGLPERGVELVGADEAERVRQGEAVGRAER